MNITSKVQASDVYETDNSSLILSEASSTQLAAKDYHQNGCLYEKGVWSGTCLRKFYIHVCGTLVTKKTNCLRTDKCVTR
jgi:hypothetical protein